TPFWKKRRHSCRACAKCRTRSPAISGTLPLAMPCRIFKGRVNSAIAGILDQPGVDARKKHRKQRLLDAWQEGTIGHSSFDRLIADIDAGLLEIESSPELLIERMMPSIKRETQMRGDAQ
ncbi:MAG: hypothetical protein ACYCS3_01140, partial [Acidithiobacillus sp.]